MPNTKTKASNEPYRKVKITMWDDPKFRALSALPPSGQSLFIYLLTSPFTGIIPGLFKAGRAAMAEELGWEVEDFDLALGEALALGMVKADMQARVFWLPNAAKHNPPASLNVVKSWVRAFELLPDCPLKWEARESLRAVCYGVSKAMGEAFDMALPLPKDMPSPLPSGIQRTVNSKQLKEDPPLPPKGERADKSDYSPEFEEAWSKYPKRAGGNSKQAAFKAWKTRIKSGVAVQDMINGAARYAAYMQVTGKINTEYVQQAATFFGPSCHYENEWLIPTQSQYGGKDINHISPPDNAIPPGFRG